MSDIKNKRILLKISGEQLSGDYDGGIDPKVGLWIANQVKKVYDHQIEIVLVVGGGNFARGFQLAGHGIKRVTADHIGMLGTLMNALALTDIFEDSGLPTRCLSSIFVEQVAEPFIHRLANKHLERCRIVIIAGGIGRPYLTTDTAAVSLALELNCQVVLKATKFDGIYDKDPQQFKEASKIKHLNFSEAVANQNIKVMDKAALALAMDYQLPVVVFNIMEDNSLYKTIIENDIQGTLVD
jgi:uridylate kinase